MQEKQNTMNCVYAGALQLFRYRSRLPEFQQLSRLQKFRQFFLRAVINHSDRQKRTIVVIKELIKLREKQKTIITVRYSVPKVLEF